MRIVFILFFICLSYTSLILSQEIDLDIANGNQKSFIESDRKLIFEIPIWIPGFVGEFPYEDISI